MPKPAPNPLRGEAQPAMEEHAGRAARAPLRCRVVLLLHLGGDLRPRHVERTPVRRLEPDLLQHFVFWKTRDQKAHGLAYGLLEAVAGLVVLLLLLDTR